MLSRLTSATFLLAAALSGQTGQISQWTPPAGESRSAPKSSCAALRALTGYEFSIVTAVVQPASGNDPEFCRVTGQVQPDIRFEIALPVSWNRRLVMIGNGGYAGENLEAPNRAAVRQEAMRAGFAFTQTNTGHDAQQEPLGSFAQSSQKLLDYSFRAIHVTAETAKRVAAAYYGSAPARSYFVGCSTGGRQALMSAQRFPLDFDGIVAGAPVLDFVSTMVNYVALQKAFAAAPVLASKMKLIADAAYALCDGKDGLKDGLIDDPTSCGFQPSKHLPKCASGDGADCFTEGQIRSLEALYSDQKIAGQRVFPAWPVGAEIAGANGRPGWYNWLVRDDGPPIQVAFSESFFRFLAFPAKDPSLKIDQVDLERDSPKLEWIRRTLNATDSDLSGFRDRGGKLLMWFGWADPALNPSMGVEYYESVLKTMGPSTRDFFRLFMNPGVFHCGGGPGCDSMPLLATVIDWVEQGKAPDRVVASRRDGASVVRSRPLCPYPQKAKYKGAGSIDDAANFTCQ